MRHYLSSVGIVVTCGVLGAMAVRAITGCATVPEPTAPSPCSEAALEASVSSCIVVLDETAEECRERGKTEDTCPEYKAVFAACNLAVAEWKVCK